MQLPVYTLDSHSQQMMEGLYSFDNYHKMRHLDAVAVEKKWRRNKFIVVTLSIVLVLLILLCLIGGGIAAGILSTSKCHETSEFGHLKSV